MPKEDRRNQWLVKEHSAFFVNQRQQDDGCMQKWTALTAGLWARATAGDGGQIDKHEV